MPLDVNLVKNPLRGLQEVFLHLHGDIPGQEAHEQPLLDRRDILCQTVRTSTFPAGLGEEWRPIDPAQTGQHMPRPADTAQSPEPHGLTLKHGILMSEQLPADT